MKKLLAIIIVILFGVFVVNAQTKKELRAEKRQAETERVAEEMNNILSEKQFVFEPTQYVTNNPKISGALPSKNLTGYYLKIINGELSVSLPFFGNAQRATLEGGAIDFITDDYIVITDFKRNNKGWIIEVNAKDSKRNYYYKFTFDIMSNGNVLLVCDSEGRDSMKFYGDITLP